MTAATSSKQPGLDPQSTHRDLANQPERVGTIPWEALGASDYRTAVSDLGLWLAWLVPTYRIPPSVIPPCWFLHPGLIEELGHLWTGWRITRHPESGVGMVGLEWDGHRERATARLRELVATAGCNGTNHSPKQGPLLNRDDQLWEAHFQAEKNIRTTRSTQRAIIAAAGEVLRRAEQRNELALNILSTIATDPNHPTETEILQSVIALENNTLMAPAQAQRTSQEIQALIDNTARKAVLAIELAAARADLLAQISAGCAVDIDGTVSRWAVAVANAAPADEALYLAARTNTGRSAAARLASPKTRLNGTTDYSTVSDD